MLLCATSRKHARKRGIGSCLFIYYRDFSGGQKERKMAEAILVYFLCVLFRSSVFHEAKKMSGWRLRSACLRERATATEGRAPHMQTPKSIRDSARNEVKRKARGHRSENIRSTFSLGLYDVEICSYERYILVYRTPWNGCSEECDRSVKEEKG